MYALFTGILLSMLNFKCWMSNAADTIVLDDNPLDISTILQIVKFINLYISFTLKLEN